MLKIIIVATFTFALCQTSEAQSNDSEVLLELLSRMLHEQILGAQETTSGAVGSADLIVYINKELQRHTDINLIDRRNIKGKEILFLNDEGIFVNGPTLYLDFIEIDIGRKKSTLTFSVVRTTSQMQRIIEDSRKVNFRKDKSGLWVLR